MYKLLSIIFVLLLLIFAACDIYEQDEYQELVVMEAYAIAGRPLPDVRLSTTVEATQEYNFSDAALNGASVVVTLLDEAGNTDRAFNYFRQSDGIYRSANRSYLVEAGQTYRIEASFNDRPEELRAETTVPAQFEILEEVEESYVYQSENQLEVVLTATESNARQNIYVFNTIATEASIDNLTPFYFDAVENRDASLSEFLNNSSGLINEGNFDILENQTILLRFPWIGVAFYGENQVVTNSVDQNLADLVRSEELQFGGSTLPPGEIPNLIYNIEGGIGVFGSISSDTVVTRFLRPN